MRLPLKMLPRQNRKGARDKLALLVIGQRQQTLSSQGSVTVMARKAVIDEEAQVAA